MNYSKIYDDFMFETALLRRMYQLMKQKSTTDPTDPPIATRTALVSNANYMVICFLHLRLRIWEKLGRISILCTIAALCRTCACCVLRYRTAPRYHRL